MRPAGGGALHGWRCAAVPDLLGPRVPQPAAATGPDASGGGACPSGAAAAGRRQSIRSSDAAEGDALGPLYSAAAGGGGAADRVLRGVGQGRGGVVGEAG